MEQIGVGRERDWSSSGTSAALGSGERIGVICLAAGVRRVLQAPRAACMSLSICGAGGPTCAGKNAEHRCSTWASKVKKTSPQLSLMLNRDNERRTCEQ